MPALDFPTSPINGQVYTANGRTWTYNSSSTSWTSVSTPGAQGAVGAQGVQGAVGAQGAVGVQGAVGAQGTIGAQGVQGAVGAQGTIGAQGVQGRQGSVGPQGFQGVAGTISTPTNDTTTNATYYPIVAIDTANTTLKTSSTKLTFNPNTGILTATGFAGDGSQLINMKDEFARTFSMLGY
jgi:hypothetical protein